MIELRDITFAYAATASRPVLDGVDLTLERASWCWSPAAPASASRRCSAC